MALDLERVRRAREHWLELDEPPRRALKWRRPDWEEQVRMMRGSAEQLRVAVGVVVDWRGFTEADLVGPEGGSAPEPFSREALELVLADDHLDWLPRLLKAVADDVEQRRALREQARGN